MCDELVDLGVEAVCADRADDDRVGAAGDAVVDLADLRGQLGVATGLVEVEVDAQPTGLLDHAVVDRDPVGVTQVRHHGADSPVLGRQVAGDGVVHALDRLALARGVLGVGAVDEERRCPPWVGLQSFADLVRGCVVLALVGALDRLAGVELRRGAAAAGVRAAGGERERRQGERGDPPQGVAVHGLLLHEFGGVTRSAPECAATLTRCCQLSDRPAIQTRADRTSVSGRGQRVPTLP